MPSPTPNPNHHQIGVIRNGLERCVAEETGRKVQVTESYAEAVIIDAFRRIVNPKDTVRPVIGAYVRVGRGLKLESHQRHVDSRRFLDRRAV